MPAEAGSPPDSPSPLSQRLPDTLLLIAAIGLLVFALGFLFAPGQFETAEVTRADGSTVTTVDPQSFHYSEDAPSPSLFTTDRDGRGLFNAADNLSIAVQLHDRVIRDHLKIQCWAPLCPAGRILPVGNCSAENFFCFFCVSSQLLF